VVPRQTQGHEAQLAAPWPQHGLARTWSSRPTRLGATPPKALPWFWRIIRADSDYPLGGWIGSTGSPVLFTCSSCLILVSLLLALFRSDAPPIAWALFSVFRWASIRPSNLAGSRPGPKELYWSSGKREKPGGWHVPYRTLDKLTVR
jgi:hypothetical protein